MCISLSSLNKFRHVVVLTNKTVLSFLITIKFTATMYSNKVNFQPSIFVLRRTILILLRWYYDGIYCVWYIITKFEHNLQGGRRILGKRRRNSLSCEIGGWIIETRESSWSYVVGSNGRAPGMLYINFQWNSFEQGTIYLPGWDLMRVHNLTFWIWRGKASNEFIPSI